MKKVIKGHGSFTLKSDGQILEHPWDLFGSSTLTIQNFNPPPASTSNQSLPENANSKQKDAGKSSKSSKKRQKSSKSSTQPSKKPKVEKSPVEERSSNAIPDSKHDDEIQQALKMSKFAKVLLMY